MSGYAPLSIPGRVIECRLKCCQVSPKVAHWDSTIISNFSAAHMHMPLTGGRNGWEWVPGKGPRMSRVGSPSSEPANFKARVHIFNLSLPSSWKKGLWWSLGTCVGSLLIWILVNKTLLCHVAFQEKATTGKAISCPQGSWWREGIMGENSSFQAKPGSLGFHQLLHLNLSKLDPLS